MDACDFKTPMLVSSAKRLPRTYSSHVNVYGYMYIASMYMNKQVARMLWLMHKLILQTNIFQSASLAPTCSVHVSTTLYCFFDQRRLSASLQVLAETRSNPNSCSRSEGVAKIQFSLHTLHGKHYYYYCFPPSVALKFSIFATVLFVISSLVPVGISTFMRNWP